MECGGRSDVERSCCAQQSVEFDAESEGLVGALAAHLGSCSRCADEVAVFRGFLADVSAPVPPTPVVRVQWNDPAVIKRVLDLGAEGVMIPLVGNRRECEAAVRACKYPPEGTRGVAGSHRAAGFGRFSADYWARANAEILVIAQVETPEAVKAIDDIVTVPGVDVAFIGPADLSAALGHLGDPKHPDVQAAIARVEAAAKRAGVALGTISRSAEEATTLYGRGYQMVTLCSDASLVAQLLARAASKS